MSADDNAADAESSRGDPVAGRQTKRAPSKLWLVLFALLVPLTFMLVAEGIAKRLDATRLGLALPRGSVAHWVSGEFDVEARINSLGLRGPEVLVERTHAHRIVAIGDSFTFGWGVDLEDTWIRLLEGQLVREGLDVEVLNVGVPGASPWNYAEYAELVAPILKPDLVIIGVLQGDDISQLRVGQGRPRGWLGRALYWFYPATLGDLIRRATTGTVEIAEGWQAQVDVVIDQIEQSDVQRARFDALSPEVKRMFHAAEINPQLVGIATGSPDYLRWSLELDDPLTVAAIDEMAGVFGRIRQAVEGNGGSVLVISVPTGAYVSRQKYDRYIEIGFELEESDLGASEPDDAIRMAAERAEVPFYEVTEVFTEAARQEQLFFPYDGHFDRNGTRLFASSIADEVADHLRRGERDRDAGR